MKFVTNTCVALNADEVKAVSLTKDVVELILEKLENMGEDSYADTVWTEYPPEAVRDVMEFLKSLLNDDCTLMNEDN